MQVMFQPHGSGEVPIIGTTPSARCAATDIAVITVVIRP